MFIPDHLLRVARANCDTHDWARKFRHDVVAGANKWRDMSDEQIWSLMFGSTITRSWMVWSDGHCPACTKKVPMYTWEIDALERPWKTRCPHCQELFPKNDFKKFYDSALDAHGVFDPALGDRNLLFNADHPDPADPLHKFGVDDGEGYTDSDKRWRFIGAYLVYGQWKQAVLGGISACATAYALTGEPSYAHKALVLLDRVADLHPTFDHMNQAWVYETVRTEGFVSTWHDACEETRWMALAYDVVRPALESDRELVSFLGRQAQRMGLDNRKTSAADIRRNIEERILREAIRQSQKVHSNYPRREVLYTVIHEVLGTPEDLATAEAIILEATDKASRIDGVTGEKGLAGYTSYVIQGLALYLGQMERSRPGSLAALTQRFPNLAKTYRFHLDTWCMEKYYPQIGDTGSFAAPCDRYCGIRMHKREGDIQPYFSIDILGESMFGFAWKLYELSGDVRYVQAMYLANGSTSAGLPHDVFCKDPVRFEKNVQQIIDQHGTEMATPHVNFHDWHLGILRSGKGDDRRALWIDYDTGGAHAHADAMNIGLFAKGLDLMPDIGYPPVQFGGWSSKRAVWYTKTASHNTVVVDNRDHGREWTTPTQGVTTLWGPGRSVSAIRTSNASVLSKRIIPEVINLDPKERDRMGFYFYRVGRLHWVRVYTKPIDAPAGEQGWTLAFEDRFDRAAVGDNWRQVHGSWKIVNGALEGSGTLMCMLPFPSLQRVEYEASTDETRPCDLTAFLRARFTGTALDMGVFFGFGSNDNHGSRITISGYNAASSKRNIVTGRRHRVLCEHDQGLMRHVIDGTEVQQFACTPEAVSAERTRMYAGLQYERALIMLDLDEKDSYIADVFRVAGGRDHAKFQHSHFSHLTTQGLDLRPGEEFGDNTEMRHFMIDRVPPSPAQGGWSADFIVRDHLNLLPSKPPERQLHLRMTDLTEGAEAGTCEGWVSLGSYNDLDEVWFPRVMVRRRSAENDKTELASTFVATLEPYDRMPRVARVRRARLRSAAGVEMPASHVALLVALADGRRDVIVIMDPENAPATMPTLKQAGSWTETESGVATDAELAVARFDANGRVTAVIIGHGTRLSAPGVDVELSRSVEWIELAIEGSAARVVSGDGQAVAEITIR